MNSRSIQLEYWKNKDLCISTKNFFLDSIFNQRDFTEAIRACEPVHISDQAARRILKVCKGSDLSLYILMVSYVKGVILRYTNESPISILSPTYQADSEKPEAGFVVLQDSVLAGTDLVKNVQETRKTVIEAYSNQDYFFEGVISGSENPEMVQKVLEFNVLCLLENIHSSSGAAPNAPLTIQFSRKGEQIHGEVSFDNALLDQTLVRQFCENFSRFIESASQNFKQRIEEVNLLSDSGLDQIIEFSKGDTTEITDYKLHQLFEEQVERTPEQIALVCNGEEVDYQNLNKLANRIGRGLLDIGVKKHEHVILMCGRSIAMVAGILGVLKAGATYIPVSPQEPADRLRSILKETSPKLILTNKNDLDPGHQTEVVNISELVSDLGRSADRNLGLDIDPNAAAYVIFTSGTTGIPKGVIVEHHSIVNANLWRQKAYNFSTASRELLLFAYNFDGFVLNLFTPLISGATIVLPGEREAKDPKAIARIIQDHQITHFTTIPLLYRAVLEESSPESLVSLDRVTLAADAAEPGTLELSKELNPSVLISNEYGPTENAVIATYHEKMIPDAVRVIGTPIDNVHAYILDGDLRLLPVGVYGELYLANEGLARGYLNDPVKTAEVFVDWNGERIYRTGDLARWLPDGTIEFKGRMDHQINLRGFRIELEEVRSCLLSHEAVKEAAVVLLGEGADAGIYAGVTLRKTHQAQGSKGKDSIKRQGEDDNGAIRMQGSTDSGTKIKPQDLIDYVTGKLPHYMVPQQIIRLETIPVNETGKYDIPALRSEILHNRDQVEKELPTTDTEKKLVEIWKDILKIEEVGINQNFFTLGGHSLKATTLLSRIYNAFEADLSLNQIFITNTVKELAREIDKVKGGQVESIPKAPLQDHYILSSGQERLLVLDTLDHLGMTYNIPLAFSLKGELDVKRLENALNTLLQRHESLRTSFTYQGDKPVQIIQEACELSIIEQAVPEGARIDELILASLPTFDLENAPLFKVTLLRESDTQTYLVFDFYHIIIDETSLAIFFDELVRLYRGETLPALALSYKDYAVWQRKRQRSETYKEKLGYWVELLSGRGLEPLNLPYDYTRPSRMTYEGSRVQTQLKPELFQAIQDLCRRTETTNFMFFMAAFSVLLNKYTHQKEIILGSPVSERAHPETREMVGLFLNTIPLLNIVENGLTFSDFLKKVKQNVLEGINHSEVQFDDIVKALDLERQLDINPIFNVMLAILDNDVTNLPFEDIAAEPYSLHNSTSKFDFMLEVHTSDQGIGFTFEYATDLFREATMQQIANSFETLLENIVLDPGTHLGELQILSDQDREQLLEMGRCRYDDSTSTETTVSLFEKQVAERPDAVALALGAEQLTYRELNARVNQLAREIRDEVASDDIVAILFDRSFNAIISVLAVQKAGGAYLPLDVTYPVGRINNILSNSETKLLLTDQDDLSQIEYSGKAIHIDQVDLSRHSVENPEVIPGPDNLAYVLYTSGTTGKPKGVQVEHGNLVNLVRKAPPYFDIGPDDVWTMFHTYCFDVSVWEMFGSLLTGGKLVIVPSRVAQDPVELADLIVDERITMFAQTPTAFYLLSEEMATRQREMALRYVILGGEAIKLYKLKEWYQHYPESKLINGYGITETTVYSTYKEITQDEIDRNMNSIGFPIPTSYMYVLDENRELCPTGVLGELYIGGLAVGRGYAKNRALTEERFIQDPFAPRQRLYKTGDLGRWLPNGEIYYSSRIDHQVRVRGFRVEISEVESVLASYETIQDVVVVGLEDDMNSTQLAAYFTSDQKEDIDQIRTYLERYLSHYMVPAFFIQIDELPLSSNGKVDRSKLPNPKTIYNQEIMKREATTPLEKLMVDIWADILGISPEQISIDDNFFNIGGDSISASLVVRRLNNNNWEVKVVDVFEHKTVAAICASILAKQPQEAPENEDPELVAYWEEVATQEIEPLSMAAGATITSDIQKQSINLPVRDLLSIIHKESNQANLKDIIVTGLGMAFRMWTGEDRFRVTVLEAEPNDTVYPVILYIGDINHCEGNIDAARQSLEEASAHKVGGPRILQAVAAHGAGEDPGASQDQDPGSSIQMALSSSLSNEVLFQYYDTKGKNQATAPYFLTKTSLALGKEMQGALSITAFVYDDAIKLEVGYHKEVYREKGIKLMLENFKFSLRQIIDHYNKGAEEDLQPERVIHEVETFNEVFYRDCTYQAFIPAIRHFGRNFKLLFANSNSIYSVDKAATTVKVKNQYIMDRTNPELYKALGLKVDRFFDSQDICGDLIDHLSKGALGVVQIDCFYIPRKKELYLKKHGAHSMLIYGYDKNEELFYIIDNQATVATNYQKNTISFDELRIAYKGYNDNFNQLRNQVTIYTIATKEGAGATHQSDADIRRITLKNMKKMEHRWADSKDALYILYSDFIVISSKEKVMLENIIQLNYVIGEVLNAKKIELYKARTIIQDKGLADVLGEIVDEYEYIRNVLTKMELSGVYRKSSADGMQAKLKRILSLEGDYTDRVKNLKRRGHVPDSTY